MPHQQDETSPIAISAQCNCCGKEIPPLPKADALCVRCRYSGSHKPVFRDDELSEYDVALETTAASEPQERAEAEPTQESRDLASLLAWFDTPQATAYFGKKFEVRVKALSWVNNPVACGGRSLAEVAGELGMTASAFSKYTARAAKVFKIQNGSQRAHAPKRSRK
jgi:hypothetical protein